MTLPINHANVVSSNFIFDSIQTVCHSLYSLFTSCVNSEGPHTGSLWKNVTVSKIDSQGQIMYDRNHPDPQYVAEFPYVVYDPTGELFIRDPLNTIRVKCVGIALLSPIFSAVRLMRSLYRTVLDTASAASRFFASFFEPDANTTESRLRVFSDWSHRMKDNILKIVTAPMLLIGMELGAMVGIFMPLEGRRIVAMAESIYNDAVGIKNQKCSLYFVPGADQTSSDVCFLAQCFQPVGNMADTIGGSLKYTAIRESRLNSLPLPCLF
jgi:hypothetical protein